MNNIIHFFDLDNTLWKVELKAWIILKNKPNKPIIKLSKIQLNDILNGVYKKEENLIEYNGETYWISDNMFDKIKKKYPKIEITDLGLSFIEYINPEYFTKLNIFKENIRHLVGKTGFEIGIISSRYDADNDKNLLVSLNDELQKVGLSINKFYYVSKYFEIRNNDKINYEKMKIILEHLIGFHIKNNHFIPIKQDFFKEIHFYDDELQNINVANQVQFYLEEYLRNTEDELFNTIIDRVKKYHPMLYTHLISNNNLNRFKTTEVKLVEPINYSIKVEEKKIIKFKSFNDKNFR